jgi:PLP dependent protein
MVYSDIHEKVSNILRELPKEVVLAAAVKARTPEEIKAAIEAGINIVGENYVQEALAVSPYIPRSVKMHFIGHLQKNKVKKAVEIFDVIETVDSVEIAREIDKRSRDISKIMPVMIEINSGKEKNKYGIFPEKAEGLIREIAGFFNIRVTGLMTMGSFSADGETSRLLFRETKQLFDHIVSASIPGVELKWLSMGMSDSYRTAVQEGSNLVRVGTGIFGERKK